MSYAVSKEIEEVREAASRLNESVTLPILGTFPSLATPLRRVFDLVQLIDMRRFQMTYLVSAASHSPINLRTSRSASTSFFRRKRTLPSSSGRCRTTAWLEIEYTASAFLFLVPPATGGKQVEIQKTKGAFARFWGVSRNYLHAILR